MTEQIIDNIKKGGSLNVEELIKNVDKYKLTSNLSNEFVNKVYPYLQSIFTIKPNKTRQDDNKETKEIIYNPKESNDENLAYIYNFAKKMMKTPDNTPCKFYIGCYMRTSKMEIPKASEGTVFRVLINLNQEEVYKFIEKPENKEIYFEKDNYMVIPDFDKVIVVSSNPMSKIPSGPGAPGLPSKDRTIIRSLNYQRYTIVLDFLTPPNVNSNTSEALKNIEKTLTESLKMGDKKTKNRKKKKMVSDIIKNQTIQQKLEVKNKIDVLEDDA